MVALVTGGSGGLGGAVCRRLAADGHRVAVGFLRNRAQAERVAAELAAAIPLGLDVTVPGEVEDTVSRVVAWGGGLDVLVNAAAHNEDGLLADLAPADVEHVHAVNVAGVMSCVRAAVPHFLAAGGGRVVNFSSVLAARGTAGVSAYTATKGAVEAITRSLAAELGPKGITVNAVAPGFIDAGLGRRAVAAAGRGIRALVPLRRAGEAEEVAEVVAFLASAAARYVTGAVVPVDGGLLAGVPGAAGAWRGEEAP